METQLCPHCSSKIDTNVIICPSCNLPIEKSGSNTIYEPGYVLNRQNLKLAKIISVILSFLVVLLCLSPFINRSDFIATHFGENVFPPLILVLTVVFSLWQLVFLLRYLDNFYHPRANIFTNIRCEIIAVIIILLLGISAVVADIYNNTDLESGMLLHGSIYGYVNMQIIMSLFIAAYVLWVFVHVLTGWVLSDSKKIDFVGGLPLLGYIIIASGIIPVFLIFVPFCITDIFFRADKYSKMYGFLN